VGLVPSAKNEITLSRFLAVFGGIERRRKLRLERHVYCTRAQLPLKLRLERIYVEMPFERSSLSSFLSSVVLLTKEDGGEGWGEEALSLCTRLRFMGKRPFLGSLVL
jgi:hypothetical protein